MEAKRLSSGIQTSQVSPSYLHANSTSHTWVFSAIAELIDNAYDPDVNAAELEINQRIIDNNTCLTFVDNGCGMTPDKLHKMLSFGYCEKDIFSTKLHQAVGQYGNGFKSGSMRLGRDAIVFTRQVYSMSVGLLSQTYLEQIHAETVLTPIVTWTLPDKEIRKGDDTLSNLKAICQYSLFSSETLLLEELNEMEKLRTGTKIIIYNLKKSMNDDTLELDFSSDPTDIRNLETHREDFSTIDKDVHEQVPAYVTSLREYCSILYLRPRMKIVLRGKKVKTTLIQKCLLKAETDVYKPTGASKRISIKIGFSRQENTNDYGVMLYHKNRLIRAYEKVGYQKQPNDLGVGVVGVVDAYFLTPTHNKQDFSRNDQYKAFMNGISTKLNDYWNEKMGTGSQPQQAPEIDAPVWVQCDACLKWRRLPMDVREENLPEKWFCENNSDTQRNRCDIKEEPYDEDGELVRPTYIKTKKKEQKEKNKLQKLQEENMHKARESALQAKEHRLQQLEKDIREKSEAQENQHKSKERALQAKEHELQQLEKDIRERSETLASNSQPKPGSSQDVSAILRNLQKQAERKRKTINQIQNRKKLIDDDFVAKKKAAEGIKLVKRTNVAESGPNEVSSTSSKGKEMSLCLKTEDGDVLAEIPWETNPVASPNLLDLTADCDEDDNSGPSSPKYTRITFTGTTVENDNELDISKVYKTMPLKRYKDSEIQTELIGEDIGQIQQKVEEYKRDIGQIQQKSEEYKRDIGEIQQKAEEYKRDIGEIQQKAEEYKRHNAQLQHKMFDLMKIIVPDEDIGTPDGIEEIVTEMLNRYNQHSSY